MDTASSRATAAAHVDGCCQARYHDDGVLDSVPGGGVVKVLTVRGVDDELGAALKTEAERRDSSVNGLVVQLLKEALGLAESRPREPKVYHDLDWFFGSITDEEADEMLRVIEDECERIDEDEWR
jgi:plasmid stability protein